MHNTCVGVVIWLLGLLVPLLLMAIASRIFFVLMIEKETKKSSKTAFQKILNYLLFENFKTPVFSSEYENLSEDFIKYNKPGSSNEDALNIKLNSIFSILSIQLNDKDRTEIINSILEDQVSYDGLLFFFTMEVEKHFKNNLAAIPVEFLKMLNYYKVNNELNAFVLIYYKLYFADLFYTKFSKPSQISEQEYKIILEKFTTKKTLID